jgi:hypothetical protein
VFENRVLRSFGPKRGGVTGEWRKIYIKELRDLYFSPSIIRIIKLRPRRRWVDNIRMDLGEVGWGGVDWIGLARIGTGGELLLIRY